MGSRRGAVLLQRPFCAITSAQYAGLSNTTMRNYEEQCKALDDVWPLLAEMPCDHGMDLTFCSAHLAPSLLLQFAGPSHTTMRNYRLWPLLVKMSCDRGMDLFISSARLAPSLLPNLLGFRTQPKANTKAHCDALDNVWPLLAKMLWDLGVEVLLLQRPIGAITSARFAGLSNRI